MNLSMEQTNSSSYSSGRITVTQPLEEVALRSTNVTAIRPPQSLLDLMAGSRELREAYKSPSHNASLHDASPRSPKRRRTGAPENLSDSGELLKSASHTPSLAAPTGVVSANEDTSSSGHQSPSEAAAERDVEKQDSLDEDMTTEGSIETESLDKATIDESLASSDGSSEAFVNVHEQSDNVSKTIITTSASGRPYGIWELPERGQVRTVGVLLPDGYQNHSDPDFPWICPVRSCRMIFHELRPLGSHFTGLHRRAILNDNGDGTLSVLATRGGKTHTPPVIVSRRPLDPEEPPMAAPTRPEIPSRYFSGAAAKKSRKSPPKDPEPRAATRSIIEADLPTTSGSQETQLEAKALEMWTYVHTFLQVTPFSPVPSKAHIRELLLLPRLRSVAFNPTSNTPFREHEKIPKDIASLIMHIVGIVAPSPCQKCKAGRGVYQGCHVLPPTAPKELRRAITCCSNCLYKAKVPACSLNDWTLQTYPELKLPPLSKRHDKLVGEFLNEPDATNTRIRRPPGRPRKDAASIDLRYLASSELLAEDDSPPTESKRAERSRHKAAFTLTRNAQLDGLDSEDNTRAISGATGQGDSALEMEDWEIAPGRVRNESSQGIENIAFSTAYLTHNQAVRVADGVGFNVTFVKPGTSHQWQPEPGKMRVCSVAAGKVKVKILEQEFMMGPHGMFLIKAGVGCSAQNRSYADAVLHVAEIHNDA